MTVHNLTVPDLETQTVEEYLENYIEITRLADLVTKFIERDGSAIVKAIKAANGMGQTALGRTISYSHSTIHRIEAGNLRLTSDIVESILAAELNLNTRVEKAGAQSDDYHRQVGQGGET